MCSTGTMEYVWEARRSLAGPQGHDLGPTSIPCFKAGCQEAPNLGVCAFGQHRSLTTCLYHLLVGWLSALWCAVVDRELWCASGISCVTFDTQSVFSPCLHELFHRSADLVRAFLGPFSPFHPKQRGNNKTKRHRAVKFTYSSSEAVKLMIKRWMIWRAPVYSRLSRQLTAADGWRLTLAGCRRWEPNYQSQKEHILTVA